MAYICITVHGKGSNSFEIALQYTCTLKGELIDTESLELIIFYIGFYRLLIK